MRAVVATVRIEDSQVAREALAGLRLNLVPRAPGFVSAYWLAPIGIGMSVVVFDTKERADEAVVYPLPPLPGVTAADGGGPRGIRQRLSHGSGFEDLLSAPLPRRGA
jgi:hypothetical protein